MFQETIEQYVKTHQNQTEQYEDNAIDMGGGMYYYPMVIPKPIKVSDIDCDLKLRNFLSLGSVIYNDPEIHKPASMKFIEVLSGVTYVEVDNGEVGWKHKVDTIEKVITPTSRGNEETFKHSYSTTNYGLYRSFTGYLVDLSTGNHVQLPQGIRLTLGKASDVTSICGWLATTFAENQAKGDDIMKGLMSKFKHLGKPIDMAGYKIVKNNNKGYDICKTVANIKLNVANDGSSLTASKNDPTKRYYIPIGTFLSTVREFE